VRGAGPVGPSGEVTVSDGTHHCTIAALTAGGTGNCTLVEPAGRSTIVASYRGDQRYAAANGTSTVRVAKATPSLRLTQAPDGQKRVHYKVVVSGAPSVPPTGTVTVRNGAGTSHAKLHTSHGVTSAIVTLPRPNGRHAIVVTYSGDGNYRGTKAG
jgi:hypothetical protein